MDDPRANPLLAQKTISWPPKNEYLAFDKLPVSKPKPIIKNLLDCGSRILFGGGSKTFKTWLQCDLALCLCCGAPWLGFECHQVRPLYVNLELKEYYLQKRLREIRTARALSIQKDSFFIWNLRGFPFSRDALCSELLKRCQLDGIDIVFIDPFYKLLSQLEDENNQTHMGAVLRSFDELNKADITTAFGVHFSKGNQAAKDPEDRISGAGTIVRDADDLITLTKHEQNLAFTLDFIIRDHPPIESFVIQWNSPIMERTDLDPAKIKQAKGRPVSCNPNDLLALIKDNDDQFASHELQTKAREELGWAPSTFYEKIKELVAKKLIFKSKLTGHWNVKLRQ
jgi:hypothetical protein